MKRVPVIGRGSLRRFVQRSPWRSLLLGVLSTLLTATSSGAAERLRLSFGPLEQSISVASIQRYARSGEISSDLRIYARYIPPEQRAELRRFLNTRIELGPVAVSQFLYTPQGEILLRRLSEVVRTESNLPGFYAIRSALILAAAEPEGLTPLNILDEFPLKSIRVDLDRLFAITSDLENTINETKQAIAAIEKQSAMEAAMQSPVDVSTLPDLRQRGPYRWDETSLDLKQPARDRAFRVDLYLPRLTERDEAPPPLVVVSHGLGSNRTTFAYLATQLASYGFAVAVPEHLGSNTEQLEAVIAGRASEVVDPRELVDRPLDVKFLLDELTRLTQTDPAFRGRLNPEQVGVVGQSLGGYTALALAGAQINLRQLDQDCPRANHSLNLSLMLQCRALELPREFPDLSDRRIKAILPINPLGSSLLGSADYAALNLPVMIIAAGADTVTPALAEQIRPFTWLTTPNRYLLMLTNATHFSAIDVPEHDQVAVQLPSQIVGPDPAIAHRYLTVTTVAFFGTYLANQPRFQPYLTPAYLHRIQDPALPVSIIRRFRQTQLLTRT
ncbi:MAG TPA: alpha/beta hydrolase [Synechococcales cyanobacterium M55_K2018_004]|nr:alpha/beta hydrolase [Synechococcales cyanobacterium M55_K2018_004]